MIYNWTQIGIKEITSLYLYKQMATPSDLTNETSSVRLKIEQIQLVSGG